MLALKWIFPWALFALAWQAPSPEDAIAESGRCMLAGETPDARVTDRKQIAPGPPPLLSFRAYEGKQRGRFGNTDLMLDDAGH